MKRLISLLLALALATLAAAAGPKPKLILAIVIDQFRYDYLLRFRADYHDGLDRLLTHGAVFTDAHYPQGATVTAVGHSTFLTGAPPAMSGIIANAWYDRESASMVTSVSDPRTTLVGAPGTHPGSSPRRLLVSTVGDELKMSGSDSHVVSVSIKDRSAILPGGHMADGAYWYDEPAHSWVTSTYYRGALPEWVQRINAAQPAQRYAGARWLPVDGPATAKPFCTMAPEPGIRRCGSIEASPYGNEMIEDFAERALDAEKLGGHKGTDILAVSFSSNDYVGHAVGPDDPAVRDISIRTDRLIGKLLQRAEQRVGAGNVLVVLTGDHGVSPVPEVNQARRMPGGRLNEKEFLAHLNNALSKRFGPGQWLVPGAAPVMPYLNLELVDSHKLDRAEVERVAADAARAEPHIARVYTRSQLLAGQAGPDAIAHAVALSFFAPRYGDLLILPEPYYLFEASGTSHGTPYDYDNHVPVIFAGPGIKPGTYTGRILVNDIAPTLAQILGVETPAGSIGRVLGEMLN
ncbi:MAG TPA: alkaline phosphatase family protein [Bryobacteraceae bacterium]|jgi:predicted AlkP superfamily pyrophosphatase or phosphodiesterase|nr:alkaline phosphatase family protein [Bryobacteraceae bacterium]